MNIEDIRKLIEASFKDVIVIASGEDLFFHHCSDKKFPFATIVTKDNEFDNASNLDRENVYRLNIGIGKTSFKNLFGKIVPKSGLGGFLETGIDFRELDKIIPHPMYGNMYWISVLNPSAASFQEIMPYLKEAYTPKSDKSK